MANNLQEIFRKKIIPVTFDRTIGLFGATTIGVGALMGAGVYVLIGMAAGIAGPSVWLSYTICGLLAFITTLLFAELARLVPVSGGGYAYAYQSLGSVGGFVTGWFLALGSIFACGLYAIGFAEYFTSILGYRLSPIAIKLVSVGLVLFSTWLNSKGTKGADRIQHMLTWGNLGILLLLVLFSIPKLKPELMQPVFPSEMKGTFSAIGIIYISFFGYQLIANSAEETKNPTVTIPRAMILSMIIAFVAYLFVGLAAIMVIPTSELAASNAPLVLVATKSFGSFGWILISFGGILASAGALNSTLLSQGRQIYAMGKNRFLPDLLGRIHQGKKTPQAALLAGGIFIVIFLLILPLEFIAKSANFCLLVSLLPVSLALRNVYRTQPDNRPKNWFRRILPELALLTNIGLLTTLDWVSLVFGSQLALAGGLVFFFYSRKRETRSRAGLNVMLSEDDSTENFIPRRMRRILMPMANPETQTAIFKICDVLLEARKGGEIIALSVVNSPEQTDFYTALSNADYSLKLMERIQQLQPSKKVEIRPLIRASRNLAKGIVHAAEDEKCNLIVMGYPGRDPSAVGMNLMEEVLNQSLTDLILLRIKNPKDLFEPKKIAVSLGGRNNLDLMVKLSGALASRYGAEITFLNILPENFTKAQQSETGKIFIEAIQKHNEKAVFNTRVLTSNNPIDTLVEASAGFDLLIVGTTKVGMMERVVAGNFATQITELAQCDVAVVRVQPASRKLIKGW
jgi:amino acid transporter/nucleotide-binding universal stress UspA family protein